MKLRDIMVDLILFFIYMHSGACTPAIRIIFLRETVKCFVSNIWI